MILCYAIEGMRFFPLGRIEVAGEIGVLESLKPGGIGETSEMAAMVGSVVDDVAGDIFHRSLTRGAIEAGPVKELVEGDIGDGGLPGFGVGLEGFFER